eukprot:TRINITY_DN2718_c0_g2_i4.p1 TRINITY_DN2718_c0_g2~~TRINITY_DN2718_c0_g2_i4.p1  ORF type:complete len:381 (+),score=52.92 TRINITY_DN2718_c0_g2_i4:144-1286(+)
MCIRDRRRVHGMNRKRKPNWAERRAKAKRNKGDEEGRGEYPSDTILENKMLEKYYRTQLGDILTEEDFIQMFETMKQRLPITFRVCQMNIGYQRLSDLFVSPEFTEKMLSSAEAVGIDLEKKSKEKQEKPADSVVEEKKEEPLKEEQKEISMKVAIKHWDFYPNKVLFEIKMSRHELKRSEGPLSRLHKFVQICTDCGLINRQEVVSMLPPLLLDVEPGMRLLDMCAAPGSKTSQLLEKCFGESFTHHDLRASVTKEGIVVANDSDYTRTCMLTHQLQRFDTASLLVINHDAQNLPSLYYDPEKNPEKAEDSRYLFDRILCDVPCSSDAAIRKIPKKMERLESKQCFRSPSPSIAIANQSFAASSCWRSCFLLYLLSQSH